MVISSMSMAASQPLSDHRLFVVMGVAACGKSTVGFALADRIGATYIEGDSLHPLSNIAKMSTGNPLTDDDRAPWLERVGETLADGCGRRIAGCSALTRAYRDHIRVSAGESTGFLHLVGTRAVIEARMHQRTGHFMPVSLLDSQFSTLEPLQPDEVGFTIDIDRPVQEIVAALATKLVW